MLLLCQTRRGCTVGQGRWRLCIRATSTAYRIGAVCTAVEIIFYVRSSLHRRINNNIVITRAESKFLPNLLFRRLVL